MEGLELICFQMISFAGTARSMYIKAIRKAKNNEIEEARKMVHEGKKLFIDAHKAHAGLLSESTNNSTDINILLIHAEDQMMSAETLEIITNELIDICEENFLFREQIRKDSDL